MATTMAETVEVGAGARLIGARMTIVGALGMVIGAVFNLVSGADADVALENGDIAGYLAVAESGRQAALINLSVWIVAICVLCAGGVLLASSSRDGVSRTLSMFAFTTGAGTAVMFFSLWAGVVAVLAPASAAGEPVEAVAHALLMGAVNADWVITVMVLSVGGGFLVLSGRDDWAPTWLVRWAYLAFAAGLLALVVLVTGPRMLASIDVLIGIGLLIAAGVVATRGRR
ncbi:MAG: hypothetical protein WD532_12275 [Acidimicrobiia bacterium]